jgi:hypothetical protein
VRPELAGAELGGKLGNVAGELELGTGELELEPSGELGNDGAGVNGPVALPSLAS